MADSTLVKPGVTKRHIRSFLGHEIQLGKNAVLVFSIIDHNLVLLCCEATTTTMMALFARVPAIRLWLVIFLVLSLLLMNCIVEATTDSDTTKYVTCGSAIKLKHMQSGGQYLLYSENARNQGSGASGGYIVTFSNQHKDSDRTLWLVQGGSHSANNNCTTAEPIRCGSTIRLSHVATKRNLYSTNSVRSSLSRQQEVTARNDDDNHRRGNNNGGGNDDDDSWIVKCSGQYWQRRGGSSSNHDTFQLVHVTTKRYLGAADNVYYNEQNCGVQCPIMHHLEAFGRRANDEYGVFQIAESGLFFG